MPKALTSTSRHAYNKVIGNMGHQHGLCICSELQTNGSVTTSVGTQTPVILPSAYCTMLGPPQTEAVQHVPWVLGPFVVAHVLPTPPQVATENGKGTMDDQESTYGYGNGPGYGLG